MKKIKIQLTVIFVILAVLIIGLFALKKYNSSQEAAEAEDDTHFEAFSMDTADIYGISFTSSDGEYIGLYKQDDLWYLENNEDVDIDEDTVNEILNYLSGIYATTVVTDGDSSEFGFDEPTNEIIITDADGSTTTITIGMTNEVTDEYYFIFNQNSDSIYAGDGDLLSAVNYTLEDLVVVEDDEETEDTSDTEVSDDEDYTTLEDIEEYTEDSADDAQD